MSHPAIMTDLNGITTRLPGVFPALEIDSPALAPETKELSFADLLSEAVGSINDLVNESDSLQIDLALGRPVELHQVMLAASKAQIAMELFIELRNKLIEAYQEISRMNI